MIIMGDFDVRVNQRRLVMHIWRTMESTRRLNALQLIPFVQPQSDTQERGNCLDLVVTESTYHR